MANLLNKGKADKPLLEVKGLKMHFPVRQGVLMRAKIFNKAVDDVNLTVHQGETLGIVGESGCGKSTLGKSIIRLYKPTGGKVIFEGEDITHMSAKRLKPRRRNIQMIFQDPVESLNARHTVGDIIEEPLKIQGIGDTASRKKRVLELLDIVGLQSRSTTRYPFEFSGGQRQRIGIARAIALNPKLIICDEPVSALDVSIQSQILNLLNDLQREMNLSYFFIAHDLAVVKHISDRIAIMYLGKVVEIGDGDEIYKRQRHPYTKALISAIPIPDPHNKSESIVLKGDVPSPINPPSGCTFHPRCPFAQDICKKEVPQLREVGDKGGLPHQVSCHFDL
ncbi:MAG: dipeptide ABC transporter ATP-binding protein [Alphaproteobacteria bacterium]|nr:MAG: dipeptide ABC transporter ATP-binding protein [Alphaproteobacteria bacterium]